MRYVWMWGMTVLALAAGPAAAAPAAYTDEADAGSLLQALDRTEAYLASVKKPAVKLGDREVSLDRLRRSAARFKALVSTCWGTPEFETALRDEFEPVEMPGTDGAGTVHFTGYYQPLLEAREAPDATFRHPLYAAPRDQLVVDAGAFKGDLAGQRWLGRVEGNRVLPYYTRAEIEDGQVLKGRGLELAYVADELALFGLMVQGSGMLRFGDGRVVNANYAGQNGHPYVSLGKTLIADGQIPADKISMPAIQAYFKQYPDRLHTYLLKNPSYVFFQLAKEGPFGSSGIQLVPGRAIATDKRLFPPGTIAFLEYPRARFDAQGKVAGWETGGRFVVDQDTGGAILGPGRIDIYWGAGDEAARRAGTLNGNGRATFLLLKDAP
jgi:membrane-bound lytic murein transglycosylase A